MSLAHRTLNLQAEEPLSAAVERCEGCECATRIHENHSAAIEPQHSESGAVAYGSSVSEEL